ncbi:TPA: hypothetical protein NRM86_001849 [Klebsiella pneumoniae]|nr:hypothetical protein [Klebsiella pneumoniae]
MNVKEVDGVFHCDCGFSWSRGKNGNHNCADGLRKKIQQLVADNEKAMDSLRQADAAIKLAHEKYSAIAAENVGLKAKMDKLALWPGIEFYSSSWEFNNNDGNEVLEFMCDIETPATDRIVAGIKADGVEEFIGRLQQHVDEGDFVGDEVAVIVGAIDCGKEFFEQLREGAK